MRPRPVVRATSGAWLAALAMALVCGPAIAQPFPEKAVPPGLKPWIPWVLDRVDTARCPAIVGDDQGQCQWPGELSLDVTDTGGSFRLHVVVDADSVVSLPGSADHWPEQVQVDGRSATVLDDDDAPAIRLGAGAHEVTGRYVWDDAPERLPIPSSVALVRLRLRGKDVPQSERVKSDSVWLGPHVAGSSTEPERAEVDVFRRLSDGVPFRVDTRIVLRVSGPARELALGRPLLPGSRPIDLSSSVPVRLDDQGALFLQVRAGEHEVVLGALLPKPPDRLVRQKQNPPWPEQEIWVWSPAPSVRQVRISGLAGIDPARTRLPGDWRDLSAYVAGPASTLDFQTLQRGQAVPQPNSLRLHRTLWPDADGNGFTVQDHLEGEMHRDWRLELRSGAPSDAARRSPASQTAQLGRVRFGKTDQLITIGPSGYRGVEVRQGNLDVVAEWRFSGSVWSALPAGGWSEDLDLAAVSVELPPGWRYLGSWGAEHAQAPADELAGEWYPFGLRGFGSAHGGLFGWLYAIAAAVVTGRLLRWYWGVAALLAVGLSLEYELAPFAVWAVLLVLLAALRCLQPGAVRRVVGLLAAGASLGLMSATFTFLRLKLPTVAYPDAGYERHMHGGPVRAFGAVGGASVVQKKVRDDYAEIGRTNEEVRRLERMVAPAKRAGDAQVFGMISPRSADDDASDHALVQQLDVNATVQTGPGVPNRFGSSRLLSWDGPVQHDATFRLLVLNRWQNALLGWVHAASIVAFGYALMAALVRAYAAGRRKNGTPGSNPVGEAPGHGARHDLPDQAGPDGEAPGSGPGRGTSSSSSPARTDPTSAAGSAFGSATAMRVAPALPLGTGLRACLLALGALGAGLAGTCPARAEMPTQATLTELRERLTRTECEGRCISVPKLALRVREATLTLDMQVHAGKTLAFPLPGPASSWVPRRVSVDGRTSKALVLGDDGHLQLRLDSGPHRVVLEGPIGATDLTLSIGSAARRVTVAADGWEVDGLREGRIDGSVVLTRNAAATTTDTTKTLRAQAALPPWLEVHRTFEAGVTWKIHTVVTRISKHEDPLAIRFPLLPGEEVTNAALASDRGSVLLSLARAEPQLDFFSMLKPTSSLTLVAAEGQPWSEVWTLECGGVWHCETSGLAPSQHQDGGKYQPQFRPWPGEHVDVHFTRPAPAPGVSTTIDEAHLSLDSRAGTAELALDIRASAGGIQVLTLPSDARVMSLSVDGESQPTQLIDGQLNVVLQPGQQHVTATFRPPAQNEFLSTAPLVYVGSGREAVNVTTSIRVRDGHFPLFVGGTGERRSVVLWWGVLAILAAGALALSFLPYNPVPRWQWVLLALGFSQTELIYLLPLVGWFFLIGWRQQWSGPMTWRKNLAQVGILACTAAAALVILGALHFLVTDNPNVFIVPDSGAWVGSSVDRVLAGAALPQPWVLTAPDWSWRLVHLMWAAWLMWFVWNMGRMGWEAFSRGGSFGSWRRSR